MALLRMSAKSFIKNLISFCDGSLIIAGVSPHWISSINSLRFSLFSSFSMSLGTGFSSRSKNLCECRIPYTILLYEH